MPRFRVAVVIAGLSLATVVAMSLVDCAAPTQIVVEVYSDACPGAGKPSSINQTGISVGKPDDIEARAPSATKDGCEKAPGVGTLTIYPSGDNDSEVAIKVVAGVTATPDRCFAPDYAGCIAHRRVMRFIPNTTQRAIVRLSLACLNLTCKAGQTCDNGVCKDEDDLLPDGGTVDDAATFEGGKADGAPEPVDAAADACYGCTGLCSSGECRVDCTNGCAGELCAKGLPCTVTCPKTGKCENITCTTSEKCSVKCGPEKGSCNKVVCTAGQCDVDCNGARSCESTQGGGIFMDAGTKASLSCTQDHACNAAGCKSPNCDLRCNPGGGPQYACPTGDASTCSGECSGWTNPSN